MADLDLAELRRLAGAAEFDDDPTLADTYALGHLHDALSPAVVLQLLDRLEAAEARVRELEARLPAQSAGAQICSTFTDGLGPYCSCCGMHRRLHYPPGAVAGEPPMPPARPRVGFYVVDSADPAPCRTCGAPHRNDWDNTLCSRFDPEWPDSTPDVAGEPESTPAAEPRCTCETWRRCAIATGASDAAALRWTCPTHGEQRHPRAADTQEAP